MPVEDKSEEVDSPKKTRGGKVANKLETISPAESTKATPAKRVTRRTSQLDDNNETMEEVSASPAVTRRSARTRKITTDDTVDTPVRRSTRRGSTEPQPIPVGTPQRRTRSSSIQSEDGNNALAQVVQKQPGEETIQEEHFVPVRRTRASSITSEEGSVANVGTPKKRGRMSLVSKPIEPVIEESEENQSPVRPVTRSMSNSPANVSAEKSTPTQTKSPLVTKTPELLNDQSYLRKGPDDTILTIVKEISQKLSQENQTSPLSSPVIKSKTPQKNESLLLSSEKKGSKTPERSFTETPNRNNDKTPKGTPVVEKSPAKLQTSTSNKKSPAKQQTPTSNKKSPAKQQTPTSNKKSPGIQANNSFPATKGSVFLKSFATNIDKDLFSKSWSQPIHGTTSDTTKIDSYSAKKIQRSSMSASKVQMSTFQVSSSSDECDAPDNGEFLDDEAEEVVHYETDDSKDEDEKAMVQENRMHEELGEEIGSEDSESIEDEEYDDDSFIVSEGEQQDLLSYSDDDEHLNGSPLEKKSSRNSKRLVLSTSEEESEAEGNVSQKVVSEKKLPKIKLLQRISTGDPDISCKPMETTLFNSSVDIGNTTKMNESVKPINQTIQEEDEEMEVDPHQRRSINKSAQKIIDTINDDSSEAEIELPVATEAQLVAAASSLLNASKKNRNTLTPQKSTEQSPSNKKTASDPVASDVNDTESASSNESEDEDVASANKSVNKTLNGTKNAQASSSDSSDDDHMEVEIEETPEKETNSAKRKRRRRTAGMDDSVSEQHPVKKTKLNVSLVNDKKLDTILEACNELLREKKEEKTKNKLLHKKEKEEKKKRKELLKQKEKEEGVGETPDSKDEALKKKKKKQKIGRKYNQDIAESTSTKQEEVSQALKRSQEILEKKRERKRLKKQAKLEKAKEAGVEIVKKKKSPKSDKENVNKSKSVVEPEQPKKQKTLLTAFEVKQQVLQNTENGKEEKRPKKNKKLQSVQEDVKTMPDKENNDQGPKKQKKKKVKVLEPVHDSNHSETSGSPSSPVAKKRMLSILNPKGSLNKNGFAIVPVTPEQDRLQRNRGFVEEPATPRPIGFKVQSMMPAGQEFVKKANKKRKRVDVDIPEVSRLPPKPVWTASGAFEEIDAPETSEYIPLSTDSRTATHFGVSVLGKKHAKETKHTATQGLSSFKMKALYKDKSRLRESSKEIARKMEKQQLYKRFAA